MSSWDESIFTEDVNVEFLDELSTLDGEEIIEAVDDACTLALRQPEVSDVELHNGLAAATIAAIWAGAPYSAGAVVEDYPFIREFSGAGSEELRETAAELLETSVEDADIDVFLEALN